MKGLGAGLLSLPLALVFGEPLPPPDVALQAMLLGAVCYGASMICFILALRALGAGLALIIAPAVPGWQFVAALPLMAAGAPLIAPRSMRTSISTSG